MTRAPRSTSRRAGCPRRATGSRRPCSRTSRRATASLRRRSSGPVLSVLTFRTPDEAVEKANNTPYGLSAGRLDGEGLAHPLDGRAPPGRGRVGEHLQPFRSDEPVRRLQGVGLRPRGRSPRARALPRLRRLRSARHAGTTGRRWRAIDRRPGRRSRARRPRRPRARRSSVSTRRPPTCSSRRRRCDRRLRHDQARRPSSRRATTSCTSAALRSTTPSDGAASAGR